MGQCGDIGYTALLVMPMEGYGRLHENAQHWELLVMIASYPRISHWRFKLIPYPKTKLRQ